MLKPSARLFPLGTVLEGETPDYNPNNFYVGGIWEQTQEGLVAVGLDASQTEFNSIGKTGGSKTHTLTEFELPTWVWTAYSSTGSGAVNTFFTAGGGYTMSTGGNGKSQPHNNLPPYKVVYKWKLISYSN